MIIDFNNWIKKMSKIENNNFDINSIEKLKFNDENKDFANDYDNLLSEIIKMAMHKSPQETISFLTRISRDDDDMKSLVEKLIGTPFRKNEVPKDEVVPSLADQGRHDVDEQ